MNVADRLIWEGRVGEVYVSYHEGRAKLGFIPTAPGSVWMVPRTYLEGWQESAHEVWDLFRAHYFESNFANPSFPLFLK